MREINRSHSNNPIKKEEFCLTKLAIINHYFPGVLLHNINKTSLTIYFKDSLILKLLPFTKSIYRLYFLIIKYEGKVFNTKIS